MSNNVSRDRCSLVLDYISGACTAEEASAFEAHLVSCAECRAELAELREIWEVLPANMEIIDPPADLKIQVMDAVMAADSASASQPRQEIARTENLPRPDATAAAASNRRNSRSRLRSISAWVAALLVFLLAGAFWGYKLNEQRQASIPTLEEALSVSAAQIKQLIPLKPVALKEGEQTYGVACLVDNGSSRQFIVYVFGAKATRGKEAYQVWLVENGQRRSAGTFRVEEKMRGIGVLSMPIASDQLTFDTIGITLEPDDRGDQPRGTKMFGSES
ncbi:anti-sigma factor domain-containing protein [Paenibacillus aurantiacus]|uniref:Anti-sigma-W factor RsiW n=1 Tax=Paenibacillus aurantiacus TaxID=1936118 RepID=A0ABV5KU28_9BACL